jgi:predicted nucleic acid-binding Zn ribbon protein
MARPQKDTVSYFPHDSNAIGGDTVTVLQSRYGNDGYAFWFKLLEKLASSPGHYIDCRNPIKWQLLLAKTGVNEITGVEIMNLLVEMQAIDGELWESKVIWCQNLVNNLADVYKNRRRELPQKPVITDIKPITTGRNCVVCGKSIAGMRADAKYCSERCRQQGRRVTDNCDKQLLNNPITTGNNPITTGNNGKSTSSTPVEIPQSKVKKSKVNNNNNSVGFDKFWELYPLHKDKAKALTIFKKLNPSEELLTEICQAITNQVKEKEHLKNNGEFASEWKYPARWLRDERWKDVITVTKNKNDRVPLKYTMPWELGNTPKIKYTRPEEL